jgi:hypothetical protein
MAVKWFSDVTASKRIEIPEIDGWIELRQELSIGEKRAMYKRAFKGQVTKDDGETRNEYDMAELSFAQVLAYLSNWSAKEDIHPDNVKAMHPEVYAHIEAAVQKHVEEVEKNAPKAGAKRKGRPADQTSPSAAA